MASFLACYDYGQDGIWFYVDGESVLEVSKAYPELLFFPSNPPWWNEEHEKAAQQTDATDILERLRRSA